MYACLEACSQILVHHPNDTYISRTPRAYVHLISVGLELVYNKTASKAQ